MSATGRTIPVSVGRRIMVDMLRACHHVPLIPIERTMDLGPLVREREHLDPSPSWVALFAKAFALVSARRPELRRVYLTWPLERIYEHPDVVASVAFERELAGEPAVIPAPFPHVASAPIRGLDAWLRRCKTDPVRSIPSFRRVLALAKLPWPARRLGWWVLTDVWGGKKARLVGTFAVSVTASLGSAALLVRSPCTSILHYGVFDETGRLPVRLTFDHRVYDGATAARVLADLEAALLGEVLAELTACAGTPFKQLPVGRAVR